MTITNRVFERVLQLRHKGKLGTCFALDVDQKQYIITAKHCIKDFSSSEFHIFHDGSWKQLTVQLVGYGTSDSDIAILTSDVLISQNELRARTSVLAFGQEVFFLGFPFGLSPDVGDANRGFPMPFIKGGRFSAISSQQDDLDTLFIDGFNNPGFSGGPVVFQPINNCETQWEVAGVVSGYRYQVEDVLLNESSTGLVYKANTGIVIAHGIKHAVEMIRSNPVGKQLGT